MSVWIIICVVETIVGGCIIKKLLGKLDEIEKDEKYFRELACKKDEVIKIEKRENDELKLSLENARNTHKFINEIIFKQTSSHQRYLKIYQKELSYSSMKQVIYAVFYEDDYIYEMSYLKEKNENFDVNIDVIRFKLNCSIFIDGKELDPSLNESIPKNSFSIKIEELNMNKHEGKGAGSVYLDCLSKELLRYPQIQYLYGGLSSVDIKNKNKLVRFYEKNGFEDIKPMTEKRHGYVRKKLDLSKMIS